LNSFRKQNPSPEINARKQRGVRDFPVNLCRTGPGSSQRSWPGNLVWVNRTGELPLTEAVALSPVERGWWLRPGDVHTQPWAGHQGLIFPVSRATKKCFSLAVREGKIKQGGDFDLEFLFLPRNTGCDCTEQSSLRLDTALSLYPSLRIALRAPLSP
jgi:hypothetical protein